MKNVIRSWLPALCLAFGLPLEAAGEIRATLDDQRSVAVTIYNENLALIKDQRRLALPLGESALAIREVSAQIRPETALLRSIDHPGAIKLIEQNFDYDLLTPAKLLDKYVGRKVKVIRTNSATGNESTETATVLSTNQGTVLQFADRIEAGSPGRIVFEQVPENLRDRPTLVLQLANNHSAAQTLELSYLSGGLSWQADYVAELSEDENRLSLNGWVTLRNQSGVTYHNALLQLVAGDVQQVAPQFHRELKSEMRTAAAAMDAAVSQESLFEYHLYTLERPTTVRDRQTKQVSLLSASRIPVSKEYLLDGRGQYYGGPFRGEPQKEKIGVFLKFTNDRQSNLGLPLPKGVIRVYKNDASGRAQFVGEDRIDHTPNREKVRMKLGNAFDVTAERVQSSFRKRQSVGQYSYSAEVEQTVTLKNAKKQPVDVIVREPIPGDWEMLAETRPHRKVSSNAVEWTVTVPAESEATHQYVVLVRF